MSDKIVNCTNCRAACCRAPYRAFLTFGERTSGDYEYDFIRKDYGLSALAHLDGKCVYLADDNTCKVWNKRPQVCRQYDCADDPRITDKERYGTAEESKD